VIDLNENGDHHMSQISDTNLTTIHQISPDVHGATSGFRWMTLDDHTVSLPVAHGYSVEITYERGLDLYTVRRIFIRGLKRWIKGERTHVYSDQLSEIVYRAGCFRDEF
jgi:hypothetical protein